MTIDQRTPQCFYCDGRLTVDEAKLTALGKVYGPCCADLVRVLDHVIAARTAS
jgi:hypothetical protein